MDKKKLISEIPAAADILAARETVWENTKKRPFAEVMPKLPLTARDIDEAQARLERFAPFIERRFPQTALLHGIIESPLDEIPSMRSFLNNKYGAGIEGRLLLKRDCDLAVAGSVKARGGIYEVLRHTEELALEHGLLTGDYTVFDTQTARDFFKRYSIHVGSTGNLGLSIGIMAAATGYRTTVHMSADAKKWKKELLRSVGVDVREYSGDYGRAVEEGRRAAADDPYGYFVDDENSTSLFLGCAVAARRLKKQLGQMEIEVDAGHPLFVCIPCGVGGAPGGITFGLKHEFGDSAVCIFVEPVQAPCMLLGMATGLHDGISVKEAGLSGRTAADGLAVGRPSKFVGRTVEELVSAIATVSDCRLFEYLRGLYESEGIFAEPSACAAFRGAAALRGMKKVMSLEGISPERLKEGCCIVWATGGSMVPLEERQRYLNTFL